MLLEFEGTNKLWNTDFIVDITVNESSLVIFDSFAQDIEIKYKTHEDALRAKDCIRSATGGKTIYPEGKLMTFGLWENTDVYKNGIKIEKTKPKDENDHPF